MGVRHPVGLQAPFARLLFSRGWRGYYLRTRCNRLPVRLAPNRRVIFHYTRKEERAVRQGRSGPWDVCRMIDSGDRTSGSRTDLGRAATCYMSFPRDRLCSP